MDGGAEKRETGGGRKRGGGEKVEEGSVTAEIRGRNRIGERK